MSKFEDPRKLVLNKLVLNKEVEVTSGIHGHTHRTPNKPKKRYYKIHEESFD